jgi:hypothetical protein
MGKLAGNGSAELRSNAYNGCDPFIGGGACHAPHLCRTSRIFLLVLGSENLSPRAVNKFHQELNKQLARGFRRKNLIYIYMIRWAIQFPHWEALSCLVKYELSNFECCLSTLLCWRYSPSFTVNCHHNIRFLRTARISHV